MIKRYRFESHLLNYKAVFEMILEADGKIRNKSLTHMKEMIYRHEQRQIVPQELDSFYEHISEVEVVGNSMHDLIPPDFRMHIMEDALCLKFWREDQRIDVTNFLDKQVLLQQPDEWEMYLNAWREDGDEDYLKLAGVSLTGTKAKKRKAKAVAAT